MKESRLSGKQKFVTEQHAAELSEPDIGALNLPARFVNSRSAATDTQVSIDTFVQ
jgi:hypothetical protein